MTNKQIGLALILMVAVVTIATGTSSFINSVSGRQTAATAGDIGLLRSLLQSFSRSRAPAGPVELVVSHAGGAEAGKQVVFKLKLSRASASPVSVRLTTTPINSIGGLTFPAATAGIDYLPVDTVVTFAPGETAKQFIVPLYADNDVAPLEAFAVQVSAVSGATVRRTQVWGLIDGRSGSTVTIPPGDVAGLPVASITSGVASEETWVEGGTIDFNVTLDRPSSQRVSVGVAVHGGGEITHPPSLGNPAATAGIDFTGPTPSLVVFEPGQISQPFRITHLNDSLVEGGEIYTVFLTTPNGVNLSSTASRQEIAFNDPDCIGAARPKAILSVNAGTIGTGQAVTFDGSTSIFTAPAARFNFYFGEGSGLTTSVPRASYTYTRPGSYTAYLKVYDSCQNFSTSPNVAVNVLVGSGGGNLPTVSFKPTNSVLPTEGQTSTFAVGLGAPSVQPVTVKVLSHGGGEILFPPNDGWDSATPGVDYLEPSPTTITFAPGEMQKNFSIAVPNDQLVEGLGREAFTLYLDSPSGATLDLNNSRSELLIKDDTECSDLTLKPVANFTITPVAPTVGQTVIADGSASTPSSVSGLLNYELYFKPQATVESGAYVRGTHPIRATYAYTQAGTYTATLKLIDRCDRYSYKNVTVNVSPTTAPASTPIKVSLENTTGRSDLEEGQTVSFTVRLSSASAGTITVQPLIRGGVAVDPSAAHAGSGDYGPNTLSLISFAPGETAKTFSLQLADDVVAEEIETLTVYLGTPTGSAVLDEVNDERGILILDSVDCAAQPLPVAIISATPSSARAGSSFVVDASGSTPPANITYYQIKYGDSSQDHQGNYGRTNHVYTTSGTYTASVKVYDICGRPSLNSDSRSRATITVTP